MERKSGGAMVDSRGIGKPQIFKGGESKFGEWMTKLRGFLRTTENRSDEWLKWAMAFDDKITETA